MTPAGLILAGGASSRMPGASKLVRPWGDTTVLGSVVRVARQADLAPIFVVAGTAVDAGAAEALGADRRLPAPPNGGRADSLAVGLAALPPGPVVVLLGDEPGLHAATVCALVEHCRSMGADAGRVAYADRPGHPVWLGPAARAVARDLEGEAPVWEAVSSAPLKAVVLLRDESAPIDVDSPAALARARRRERA